MPCPEGRLPYQFGSYEDFASASAALAVVFLSPIRFSDGMIAKDVKLSKETAVEAADMC